MTQQQRIENPELYYCLKLATTTPGDTCWTLGELRRRKFERDAKDGWTWSDAMNAPDTANVAYARKQFTDYGWMVTR